MLSNKSMTASPKELIVLQETKGDKAVASPSPLFGAHHELRQPMLIRIDELQLLLFGQSITTLHNN